MYQTKIFRYEYDKDNVEIQSNLWLKENPWIRIQWFHYSDNEFSWQTLVIMYMEAI